MAKKSATVLCFERIHEERFGGKAKIWYDPGQGWMWQPYAANGKPLCTQFIGYRKQVAYKTLKEGRGLLSIMESFHRK